MHVFEDLPGRAQDILATSENVVRSLTCNDLKFPALKTSSAMLSHQPSQKIPPPEVFVAQIQESGLDTQESLPKRAPWLLSGVILMALDSYFPQLSVASSLWTPLQAAIPVLHWIVSWWVLLAGWGPNIVSLASLSHSHCATPWWSCGFSHIVY
ncbi:hypothetical protein DSO57_1036580 [Entomophthora muscae]|uniref:Uncharacterized protein n=1 Tax=Entomophthora muscae TaxID=34485 RepID=A0ACC2TXP6_9FUNG|nr:hypothetical protein DSO57_1036580 [Entomophthora muscae]